MSTKHMDVAESIRRHLSSDPAHVSLITDRVVPNDDRTAGIVYAHADDSGRVFRVTVETMPDDLEAVRMMDAIGYSSVG
jgi:sirohydrochlorin ferrochelatase